ncbi:ABC transporter permease [Neptunomonas phycophila]|uniref:ABC transporter permease n=1 Tax=Neptunomonas phycophila TaxID=1572645 RepID=UPI0015BFD6FB|nr:ABC transporter permease [Neptunomonas phycophila]QLE96877.1 ABC transporter permease [Neptunomonas phycophila]
MSRGIRSLLESSYLLLVFGFIATPIVMIVVFSFNEDRFPGFPWAGFSLRWYEAILNEPMVIDSAINSVIVGLSTAIGATIIGFMAAYIDYRYKFTGKTAFNLMVAIPPAIPATVMGIALLAFLARIGLFGELKAVAFAHIAIASSFAMAIIRLRLSELEASIEPAAWNLGASRLQGLCFIILPYCRNALLAAFFLSFAVSFDEFMIAWFVGGMNETLPVRILNLLQGQVSPRINAIGTLVFALTFSLVVSALWLMRRKRVAH